MCPREPRDSDEREQHLAHTKQHGELPLPKDSRSSCACKAGYILLHPVPSIYLPLAVHTSSAVRVRHLHIVRMGGAWSSPGVCRYTDPKLV